MAILPTLRPSSFSSSLSLSSIAVIPNRRRKFVSSSAPPQLRSGVSFSIGTHLIPHPNKVDRGGEDAFFVSSFNGGVIAVADGVSGGGKRSDGRSPSEIRLINSQCGLLPRAHGSTLFTRGETQYSFPPSYVGEVGRIGAPSRREIGHSMLAKRALEPLLPSEEDFPYTIRLENTITESNGSSSLGTTDASTSPVIEHGTLLEKEDIVRLLELCSEIVGKLS